MSLGNRRLYDIPVLCLSRTDFRTRFFREPAFDGTGGFHYRNQNDSLLRRKATVNARIIEGR